GPLLIKKVFGSQAYELEFPKHWKIHPVISIEQLEPAPRDLDPFERPTNEQPGAISQDDTQY
ncbi:hypothetical protein AOQ84DRAFT_420733, partial [Glonium stellatum]